MNNLNKKQKIILITVGIILITIIGIIGFIISNKENEETIDLNSLLSEEDINNLENNNQNSVNTENSKQIDTDLNEEKTNLNQYLFAYNRRSQKNRNINFK